MWTWLIIIAIVLVLLVAFKFKEIKHKFGLVLIAVVLVFLVLSFMQVYSSTGEDLKSFDGISKIVKVYFSWLGSLFGNMGKIAGYAIHQDWGVNATNVSGG